MKLGWKTDLRESMIFVFLKTNFCLLPLFLIKSDKICNFVDCRWLFGRTIYAYSEIL